MGDRTEHQWRVLLRTYQQKAAAAKKANDRLSLELAYSYIDPLLDEGQEKGWSCPSLSTAQHGKPSA